MLKLEAAAAEAGAEEPEAEEEGAAAETGAKEAAGSALLPSPAPALGARLWAMAACSLARMSAPETSCVDCATLEPSAPM